MCCGHEDAVVVDDGGGGGGVVVEYFGASPNKLSRAAWVLCLLAACADVGAELSSTTTCRADVKSPHTSVSTDEEVADDC